MSNCSIQSFLFHLTFPFYFIFHKWEGWIKYHHISDGADFPYAPSDCFFRTITARIILVEPGVGPVCRWYAGHLPPVGFFSFTACFPALIQWVKLTSIGPQPDFLVEFNSMIMSIIELNFLFYFIFTLSEREELGKKFHTKQKIIQNFVCFALFFSLMRFFSFSFSITFVKMSKKWKKLYDDHEPVTQRCLGNH